MTSEIKNRAEYLVERAPCDPDAAAEALLIAADYLKRGEELPWCLAHYLANGIKTALRKPEVFDPPKNGHKPDRGRALLVGLHLEANNRRPVETNHYKVWCYMKYFLYGPFDIDDDRKRTQHIAAERASKRFNISITTAKRLFREQEKKIDYTTFHARYPEAWIIPD